MSFQFQTIRNDVKLFLLDTVQLNGEVVGSTPDPLRISDVFAIRCILFPWTVLRWSWETLRYIFNSQSIDH